MAFKRFTLPDGTPVTIYKRKANRHIRLSVTPDGEVRVSIPRWSAYVVGLEFARSRLDWIKARRRQATVLADGQRIGKAHRLRFIPQPGARGATGRVSRNEIKITYPPGNDVGAPAIQAAARRAAVRALRAEAERLLPKRLAILAEHHDFAYNKVTVKQMKSRWGSCDHRRNIVLNIFLIQLPWDQIDYVLLHELTHTEMLRHGPDFWQLMVELLPDVKRLRRQLRDHQPGLVSG